MMNINIAELQTDLGRELPFSFAVTAAELDALSDDYKFEDPIKVTGTVVYTGMRWRVSGKIELVKYIRIPFRIRFDHLCRMIEHHVIDLVADDIDDFLECELA